MLYQNSQKFSCRPSDLLGLHDEYEAYCVDEAVAYFGSTLEYELDKIEAKSQEETRRRRKAILQKYLFPEDKPTESNFADPALFFS